MKTCAFNGCGRQPRAHGLCSAHCKQLAKAGGDRSRLVPLRAYYRSGDTCEFTACGRSQDKKGLCRSHYAQALRAGGDRSMLTPLRRLQPARGLTCRFDGCDRPAHSRGLCRSHADQDRAGLPLIPIGQRRRPAKTRPRKPSNLPDGWNTPTLPKPKPRKKNRTGRAASDPASLFTDLIPTVTPDQQAAVLRLLTRHNNADLADMLGLTERTPA